jgi:hypothetical protein
MQATKSVAAASYFRFISLTDNHWFIHLSMTFLPTFTNLGAVTKALKPSINYQPVGKFSSSLSPEPYTYPCPARLPARTVNLEELHVRSL